MATKRKRGNTWEFVVKRKALLPKPVSLTFDDEEEGNAYVARLEALLDAGIVPPEFLERGEAIVTVADAIREYLHAVVVTDADRQQLGALYERHRTVKMVRVDYAWCEDWIRSMKQEAVLSPSTIRHYVGALARCFDWVCRKHATAMAVNPLRMLPRNYATYTDADAVAAMAQGEEAREDVERDRRLMPAQPPEARDEETRIRAILDGEKPAGRERALELHWQGALELLFTLALETAMRLREMYTLELRQVDIPACTVFLEKTKNGDKRQVPLSSVAVAAIETYREQVRTGARGMAGFNHEAGRLFPWLHDAEMEHASSAGPMQTIDKLPAKVRRRMLARITSRLSRQFARIFDAAGCDDLCFHDLRHEATSRLYERTNLSDVEIASITGHRALRMLKRYANLRGSVLAKRMW